MKIFILTLATLGFLISPAAANHTEGHAAATHNVTIEVNGLVCDFCARALEKVFYQQNGVEGVDVNLDDHVVTLSLTDEANLSDEKIGTLVTDAGYNVVKITHGE